MAEKKRVGRPAKKIDYKIVEKLAEIMCTQQEIASVLNMCVRTLQRDKEFSHIYKKGLDNGKMSLRREQMKLAQQGNPAMLIWLGKQYLDQREDLAEQKARTAKIKADTRMQEEKIKMITDKEIDTSKLQALTELFKEVDKK